MDSEIRDVLLNAGIDLRDKIVLKINSNIPPPNAPSTIKKKGSSRTLIDNTTMLTSVDARVVNEDDSTIDVCSGIFDEGVAKYAIANEYGSTRLVTTSSKDNEDEMHQGYSIITIPERSFMRTAYDENIDEIMQNVENEIGEILSKRFSGK